MKTIAKKISFEPYLVKWYLQYFLHFELKFYILRNAFYFFVLIAF